MKRLILFLLTAAAFLLFPVHVYAEKTPKPSGQIERHDGYTLVSFTVPANTLITYTTDGSAPTGYSARYKSGYIRFDRTGKLRLRVKTRGYSATYCSYTIKVGRKNVTVPKPLKKGDTIAITAPAKYIAEDISKAVEVIQNCGFQVKLGQTCSLRYGAYSGTPEQRAAELNSFFADSEVDAIMCLRGGSGCADIIDLIDYDTISANPKLFIGFSDITLLHAAIYRRCGLSTVHGPMLSNFVYHDSDYTLTQLIKGLTGDVGTIKCPAGKPLKGIMTGSAEGRIVGGNLTRVYQLIDTADEINGRDSIILLEDINENAESIDMKLRALEKSGLADNAVGFIFGEFTSCADSGGKTVEGVVKDFARRTGKPCIMDFPAGHGDNNTFLPLGRRSKISVDRNGNAKVVILE